VYVERYYQPDEQPEEDAGGHEPERDAHQVVESIPMKETGTPAYSRHAGHPRGGRPPFLGAGTRMVFSEKFLRPFSQHYTALSPTGICRSLLCLVEPHFQYSFSGWSFRCCAALDEEHLGRLKAG